MTEQGSRPNRRRAGPISVTFDVFRVSTVGRDVELRVVCCVMCVVCCVLCVVLCVLLAVCGVLCVVCGVRCAVCCVLCVV